MASIASCACSCTRRRRSSSDTGSSSAGGTSAGVASSATRVSAIAERSSSAGSAAADASTAAVRRRRRRIASSSTATPSAPPSHARALRTRRCYPVVRFLPRLAASVPGVACRRGRLRPKEGDERERERVRDLAHAGPRAPGGAPDRDRRPHPRAHGEGRRHVGRPRRLGPAAARLRDRPQGGGRLPPAPSHV